MMKRFLPLALLLALAIGHVAHGQTAGVSDGLVRFGASAAAGGGSGTVTSVGNGTVGALFSVSWATATTTPAFSLDLATQAANCVVAGPASGGSAVPTCRSLVAGDVPAHAASHNAGGSDALAIDAVAGTGSLRTLGTSSTSAAAGNDSRLSDARTPTAHASSHNAGGGDALAIDAVAGTGSLRTLGTSSTSAAAGNDSRLSDARTPTAHATSHQNGGADEVATATPGANAIPKAGAGGTLATGWVPTLVGDSGSGGTAGLAPAPAAADAAKGLVLLAAGGWGARPRVLFSQTQTVTFSNTTTETTLVGTGVGSTTLTGGTAYVGQTFRLMQAGTVNDGGNCDYVTVRYKLGSVTLSTLANYYTNCTSGDIPIVTGVLCTVRAVGAAGSISCQGLVKSNTFAANLVATGEVTVNLTTDQVWNRTDQWNSATTVSSTSRLFTVETY